MQRRVGWILIGMAFLSPLGLLTKGTAWGEWGSDDLQDMIGYIPQGMKRLENIWQAFFPDYSMNFLGEGLASEYAGYILSALVGSVLIYAVSLFFTKLLIHQKNSPVS
jgi:cobalt/nickel transport protein